jgi:hypothetical protein
MSMCTHPFRRLSARLVRQPGAAPSQPRGAALASCRSRRTVLVIAKLDRLASNARFLLSVVKGSGEADVVFCDLPTVAAGPVGKLLITQMAPVAELEAGLIRGYAIERAE